MKFPSEKEISLRKERLARDIVLSKRHTEILEYLLDSGFVSDGFSNSFYGEHANRKYKIAVNYESIYLKTDEIYLICYFIDLNNDLCRIKEVISFVSELVSYRFYFHPNRYYDENFICNLYFNKDNKMFVDVCEFDGPVPLVYFSKTIPNQINVFYMRDADEFPNDFEPKSNIFPIKANSLPQKYIDMIKKY